MLRHDPRSSHAKTTPIGASKPLRFANTTRTDVFHSLAQRVFCLVIREGFRDPTAIFCPEYDETSSTLLPCQDDSNWRIKTTPVSEIRPRFFVWNMLRLDPCSSHAMTTPIGASKLLRFANTTRTDTIDSLVQQVSETRPRFVVRNMLRHDPRSSHAKTTPIGASKPLRYSEIRSRFFVRSMLRHDPRSSHAKTTPIGASKPLRFANTTRTDVFDSLAQQVFCLVIREDF
ncbi:uncharacterized protein G2W53_033653 [Senna tora]|uniref:Uncharacterized protein n=1 Tax=Senna tora TaxID=362788 RepID=A0A834W865_9FABA|nr:uncharacterized protein G2W53_033653 [Senna tora]